jgi:putative aldouronate transport system permease protein
VVLFLPAIVYYTIFCYVPIYGIQIAFKNFIFRLGIMKSPWVGLENFKLLFNMGSFREVFRNTLIISSLKLAFGFPAPIIFAILLNEMRSVRYKKVVQTISYLPHFVSWVILGGLFVQFLSPSSGPINILIKSLGFKPIYFLADKFWFRPVLVLTSIWKGMGWGSIIYLASLSGIDPQLYEAAEIDGAGRFRKIISITLPSLVPVITIMLIFSVGGIVKDDFDQIFNLYNPAVYSVGDVLGTYTYRVGLVDMRYSFSTAVGFFTNVISFVLILITNTITKRVNEYGLW